jgi:ribosomal protein S18 acetylase RimI-like enzyme
MPCAPKRNQAQPESGEPAKPPARHGMEAGSERDARCVVRQARTSDAPRLVRAGVLWAEARVPYFDQYRSGDRAIFVADVGGEPLGIVTVRWRHPESEALADGETTAFIEGLGVAEPVRGRGVSAALVCAAERAARDRGCTALTVNIAPSNRPAIAAFRCLGFEDFGEEEDSGPDGCLLRFRKHL